MVSKEQKEAYETVSASHLIYGLIIRPNYDLMSL